MSNIPDLFNTSGLLETLVMPDADVRFMRNFYAPPLSRQTMTVLLNETAWRQEKINLWGRQHWQPRLSAWHGDPSAHYSYSGITLLPQPWTDTLQKIKHDIEAVTGVGFNSVLLNLYRNEHDSMGWHSDDERELGTEPVIASLSLGETRTFKFKHKTRHEQKPLAIDLTDGSLLIMAGATQEFWLHGIGKERRYKGRRINLTFRNILKNNPP